jgi:tubulin alpha
MNKLKSSSKSAMFDQDLMINHRDGSGGISPRGKYTTGKEISESIIESIRQSVEACDSLDGFIPYFSPLGGTGGGLTDLILEKLHVEYPKKLKLGVSIVPSQHLID